MICVTLNSLPVIAGLTSAAVSRVAIELKVKKCGKKTACINRLGGDTQT
jgi:hypothetical protein